MTSPAWVLGCSLACLLSVSAWQASTVTQSLKNLPVTTGLVGIFIPFSRTFDLVLAMGGVLLFSGYIIYDTYNITKRLSHDEYIAAAISLYLECVFCQSLPLDRVANFVVQQFHQSLCVVSTCLLTSVLTYLPSHQHLAYTQ